MEWINETLDLNIQKVEQTCNGAIAVQLLDIMYPGKIPMSKLNWGAKKDHEYVNNYKLLQTCFTKFKIDRHIDVDRLVKGKYQDNLEFMQWFKRFYEMTVTETPSDYDAAGQRAKGKGGAAYNTAMSGKGAPTVAKVTATTSKRVTTSTAASKRPVSSTAPVRSSSSSVAPKKSSTSAKPASTELQKELDAVNASYAELQVEMSGIEKERDFYFDKLRDIEMMLQDLEDNGKGNELTAEIFKILYATAEGFQPAEENVEDENNKLDNNEEEPEAEAHEEETF